MDKFQVTKSGRTYAGHGNCLTCKDLGHNHEETAEKVADTNYPLMDKSSKRIREQVATKVRVKSRKLLKHYNVTETILEPYLKLKVQEIQFRNGEPATNENGDVIPLRHGLLLDRLYAAQVDAQLIGNANVLALLVELTTWIERQPELIKEYNSTFRRYK